MKSYVQVSILLLVTCQIADVYSSENRVILESVDCTCLAPICVNATCTMDKLDDQRRNITVGAVITKKLKFLKFRIRKRVQNEQKQWKIVELDITMNYCEFAQGANNPVVNVLVPGLRQVLGETLRPCPYQGQFLINYTVEPGKQSSNRPLGQMIKTEVLLVSLNSQVFFTLALLSKVK